MWLDVEAAEALLEARPDANTDRGFAEGSVRRILDGLDAVQPELDRRGEELAAQLREAHLRVREQSGQLRRGLRVTVQKPADVLGLYVYLPVGGG